MNAPKITKDFGKRGPGASLQGCLKAAARSAARRIHRWDSGGWSAGRLQLRTRHSPQERCLWQPLLRWFGKVLPAAAGFVLTAARAQACFSPVAGREVQNAPSISQSSPHPHLPASPPLPSPRCSAAIHIDFSLPCAKP